MKAEIKIGNNEELLEPCCYCKHSFWCELCSDYHCDIELYEKGECKYEEKEIVSIINELEKQNESRVD